MRGVRRELGALPGIEQLDGPQQPGAAVLKEILGVHTLDVVRSDDRPDEPLVVYYHRVRCRECFPGEHADGALGQGFPGAIHDQ